jgi:lysophospholipase L1-like esterase
MAAGSKAILVTPPPVNEANTHYGYTTASVTNYAQVVRDLAEEYGFPMLDVFASVIADAGNPTKYADWFSEADGIHLSQQGHDWIAGQLVTAIPATLYPNNILAGASFIGAGL